MRIFNTYEQYRLSSLEQKISNNDDIVKVTSDIIYDVKLNGDKAILEYANKLDNFNGGVENLKVSENEINRAFKSCSKTLIKSLEFSANRISEYHERQLPTDIDYIDNVGVRLGNLWRPLEKVGVYVPGGTASYPSSVLMTAIPAKVAGVKEIIMVTPAKNGKVNPVVLVAAKIAGIKEIYKVGGVQAIAGLTFSNNSLPNVDKIAGPGNAYVAEAKRQLSGLVGIDAIAGPSDILVVADNSTSHRWIAADLISQAEHDERAQAILITDNMQYALWVDNEIESALADNPRKDIIKKSLNDNGAIIVIENFNNVADVINKIAPEHLELAIKNPDVLLPKINNAGAIFLGKYTPEAFGDYVAGCSHVLPTSGTSRFSSGLSVYDFLKRVSLIGCDENSFFELSEVTEILARVEGFYGHERSVKIRYENNNIKRKA